VLLAGDHHVEDVEITRRDHFRHHLQQRPAELARRPDEQRWPDSARNPWLVELRLDVVGVADRVQRILVRDAVIVSAPAQVTATAVVYYISS